MTGTEDLRKIRERDSWLQGRNYNSITQAEKDRRVLLHYIDELRDEFEETIARFSADNTRINDLYDAAAEERDLLEERMEVLSQMACENYTSVFDSCLVHQPPPPNACWPCQIRRALRVERVS